MLVLKIYKFLFSTEESFKNKVNIQIFIVKQQSRFPFDFVNLSKLLCLYFLIKIQNYKYKRVNIQFFVKVALPSFTQLKHFPQKNQPISIFHLIKKICFEIYKQWKKLQKYHIISYSFVYNIRRLKKLLYFFICGITLNLNKQNSLKNFFILQKKQGLLACSKFNQKTNNILVASKVVKSCSSLKRKRFFVFYYTKHFFNKLSWKKNIFNFCGFYKKKVQYFFLQNKIFSVLKVIKYWMLYFKMFKHFFSQKSGTFFQFVASIIFYSIRWQQYFLFCYNLIINFEKGYLNVIKNKQVFIEIVRKQSNSLNFYKLNQNILLGASFINFCYNIIKMKDFRSLHSFRELIEEECFKNSYYKNFYKLRYSLLKIKILKKQKYFFYEKQYLLNDNFSLHRQNKEVNKNFLIARKGLFVLLRLRSNIFKNYFSSERKVLKIFEDWFEKIIFKRIALSLKKYKISYFFPKYSRYPRLFKNQIIAQHRFRWLFRLKLKQLKKIFRKYIRNKKKYLEFLFLKRLEFRIDVITYRLNFTSSLHQARLWVRKGFFIVNGKIIVWPGYFLNVGDIIIPISCFRVCSSRVLFHGFKDFSVDFGVLCNTIRLFWKHVQVDNYPGYLMLNERIPAALIIMNPLINSLYFKKPLNLQYLTLSLLKYN